METLNCARVWNEILKGNTNIGVAHALSFVNSARKHFHSTNLLSQSRALVTEVPVLGI